jgi:hypothetical protein
MLGQMVGEALPSNLTGIFDPELPEEPAKARHENIVTLANPDGLPRYFVMRRSVFRDRDGHPAGLVVTFIPKTAPQDKTD